MADISTVSIQSEANAPPALAHSSRAAVATSAAVVGVAAQVGAGAVAAGLTRGTAVPAADLAGWTGGSTGAVRAVAATALLVLLTRLSIPLTIIVAIGSRLADAEEGQQTASSSPRKGLEELAA